MGDTLSGSAQKVQAALTSSGVNCSVIEMPATTRTAKAGAAVVGCNVAQIAKSIIFRTVAARAPVLEIHNVVIEIRNEQPGDSAAIQEVHTKAFGGLVEAKLVQLIAERKKTLISLVATRDDRVVGHILFSSVTIANSHAAFSGIGLA